MSDGTAIPDGTAISDGTAIAAITPQPSDAELAAILAAYSELWPRPVESDNGAAPPAPWRFSGRWWPPFTTFT